METQEQSIPAHQARVRQGADPEWRILGFLLILGPLMIYIGLRQALTGVAGNSGLLPRGWDKTSTRRSGRMAALGPAAAFAVCCWGIIALDIPPHGWLRLPITVLLAVGGCSFFYWPWALFVYQYQRAKREALEERRSAGERAKLDTAADVVSACDGEVIHDRTYPTRDSGELIVYRRQILTFRPGTLAAAVSTQVDAAVAAGYQRPSEDPQQLSDEQSNLSFRSCEDDRPGWVLTARDDANPLPPLLIEAYPSDFDLADHSLPQMPEDHIGLCLTIG